MNLSDSDDESSSDNVLLPAKRARQDTYGASSTTSHGSVPQDSDEEPTSVPEYNAVDNNIKRQNVLHYNQQSSQEDIRLSRSSLSENCSSPNDQYDERYAGTGSEEQDNETPTDSARPHFPDTAEKFYEKNSDQEGSVESGQQLKDSYSDKALRMMSKMGYKVGEGLGINGHGITEPVEASTQKGRRGLGLKPSVVGEVPRNFKWEPDDRKPDAEEKPEWMPTPPDDPLTGDQLDEWLQKGPKKLTIDDETHFADPQILNGVLNAKNIFDSLDDEDLRHARFRSNPYETIGSVMFLNRAAVKMANMDAVFEFMFTNPVTMNGEKFFDEKKEILYFADVCAGPGGFSEYVLFRMGWRAKGFGFTLKGQNDFKLSDFYAGTPETFNPFYGVANDGNVFNPANLTSLKDKVLENTDDKGVHFLMADGGFSVEGQENIQEILSKQLYLCQCLAALMLVRTGGHFVVKLFDVFTPFSVGLIYIMYRCFEKVCIHKPVTSRPANSERYLVCKWKRMGTEPAEQHLYSVNSVLWSERDRGLDVVQLVPVDVIQQDRAFYEYIYKSNCVIGENQIKNLLKIAEFSKNKSLKDSSQSEMKEHCLNLWKLQDKVRTQPEKPVPDEVFSSIISSVKMRASESNPHAVKTNVLGHPPLMLKTADDLKVFKSVYDWHFVFLNSSNTADLRFFLGRGGKQVYQLEGTRWKNAADIRLTLPAQTLFYGEVVKELRGEGNTQMHSKAVHIIDALMLGGTDISHLPLTERLNQCALFCIALDKPFDEQAVPLRCKRLFNLENFSNAMNHLEVRATKRIWKAVTVKINTRSNSQETFHVVGSMLLLKQIKEPWESRMSRKYGSKYYFKRDASSVYHIVPEAVMDTFSTHTSRVAWIWESAARIFENLPHEGLSRKEMEDYIKLNCNR